ncbi:hypothetical protein RJ640_024667 [Escallonia rubra]|uniref:RING-type E3 ubiquitin transferase n=1 Tax=Escallonia rubra TaxID=112253 RepID=A0AA88UP90_9ASTE|nr:hypothetical protein RJ640_024667 [Escallonia rubra]
MKSLHSKWLDTLLPFLFIFLSTISLASSSTPRKISYSDHCGTIIPESPPTEFEQVTYPYLDPQTTTYTGGERILGRNLSEKPIIHFRPIENVYKTTTASVYKMQAYLSFHSSNFYVLSKLTYVGAHRHSTLRRTGSLRFLLSGFWSESSGKLCMVGSASWFSASEGKDVNLEAVLKLNNYANDSIISTGFVSGTLESLSSSPSDSTYFEPVWILSFPVIMQYKYALFSKEFHRACSGGTDYPPSSSLTVKKSGICSTLSWGWYDTFRLNYSKRCTNCTPFGKSITYLPTGISLYAFQCSEEDTKLRLLIIFPDRTNTNVYQQPFDPNTTLVGEGSWDMKRNRLCVVACRILKTSADTRVGDCSTRLSLRFPAVWTIRQSHRIEGQIWTNKSVNDPGHFDRITFQSLDSNMYDVAGVKYEYTQLDKVRSCAMRRPIKNKVEVYPSGDSYEMRFDTSVTNSKGNTGWGRAVPISVGDQLYERSYSNYSVSLDEYGQVQGAPVVAPSTTHGGIFNISYKISFSVHHGGELGGNVSSYNSSSSPNDVYQISSEGVYDAETGRLCMAGCRNLGLYAGKSSDDSLDCEILVNFQFPSVNEGHGSSGFITGSIESTREKDDPLYFEQWSMTSSAFYGATAKQSVQRMDFEIIMVLVSKTLACLFIRLQLLHVKKHPNVLPFVSIVMLVILTLGHMIPLLLNFEALFKENHSRQNVLLGSGGWLEVNEVIVRVVTMVAFLLQFRVLQLVWAARFPNGNDKGCLVSQKKSLFVSAPMYILGGLIAFFMNWKNSEYDSVLPSSSFNSVSQQYPFWVDLRSYGGLVLDVFLFPQILLNVFQFSRETSLSHSFYLGITSVRLLPHAYDLYRAHSYGRSHFDGSYIYANPTSGFYSAAWDVIIPLGGVILATIVYLQQRFGGRSILPRRFRESEVYQRVPVIGSY